MNLTDLAKSIETAPAPFAEWQPSLCGEIDIRITADGQWLFHNSPIKREALVKLLASVLIKEQDQFYLKTPAEKMRIQVDDAPFVINQWRTLKHESYPIIVCQDNVQREYLLSEKHPIVLRNEIPYLELHSGLCAKVTRNVYYQWAEIAEQKNGRFVIHSGDHLIYLS